MLYMYTTYTRIYFFLFYACEQVYILVYLYLIVNMCDYCTLSAAMTNVSIKCSLPLRVIFGVYLKKYKQKCQYK